MKENPFLHYRLKAAELGINERILISHILITSSRDMTKYLKTKCDNVFIQQGCVPQISYYSKVNFDKFSLLAHMNLVIDRKKGKREFDNIEKLFEPDYSFAINGQHPEGGNDYLSITVSDSQIIKSKIELDRIKEFPKEFFNTNTNYMPALYWMLEQYAKGLKR